MYVLNTTPLFDTIRTKSVSITHSILEGAHVIFFNFADGLRRIGEIGYLAKENERLRLENARLRTQFIQYNEIKAENERLTELLQFEKSLGYKHKSAQVVGRDISPWSQWIMINAGYQDGIEKDMPLIAPGGLVGRVFSVGNEASRCMLIIDKQSKVSALVQETRALGVIEGYGTNTLKLRYLDLTASIHVGATVITSGLGGVYPKGLPIGIITVIGTENNGLHLYAHIKPFVDFSKLEEVLCLEK